MAAVVDLAGVGVVRGEAVLLDDIDLTDLDVWEERVPYEWLALLRRDAPLHWQVERDGHGFWAFTRYDDVLLTVLRPAAYVDGRVVVEELHVVTGPDVVVTIRHAPSPDLGRLRRRLESETDVREERAPGAPTPEISSRDFQRLLEEALYAWIDAGESGGAEEPWTGFAARVAAALHDAAEGLGSGETAVVSTSGGVIAAACVLLLGVPPRTIVAFNRVSVNSGSYSRRYCASKYEPHHSVVCFRRTPARGKRRTRPRARRGSRTGCSSSARSRG